jgi:hypothetical protein
MTIEPCIMCNNNLGEVEFRDAISHQAFVECLYEPCRFIGPVITADTKEAAIEAAIKTWNTLYWR